MVIVFLYMCDKISPRDPRNKGERETKSSETSDGVAARFVVRRSGEEQSTQSMKNGKVGLDCLTLTRPGEGSIYGVRYKYATHKRQVE